MNVEDRLGFQTSIRCIVLERTCGNAVKVDPQALSSLREKVPIPKDIYLGGGEIELLIGMTAPRLHQQISMYGDANGLMVMETRFGASLVGRIPNKSIGTENDDLLKLAESEIAGIEKHCACQFKTDRNYFSKLT